VSTKIVLVGTGGENVFLYLVVSDAPVGKDAFVVSDNTISEVGLWGWINKMPFTPLRSTSWHKKLWGEPEDEDWVARFVDRTKPFTDAEMKQMGAVSLDDVRLAIQKENEKREGETLW